jgi:hypothetical protein
VAVDGKTSRGARRTDGTPVHLLGAAEHGGRLLDHLEVDVEHNETSHFTALLAAREMPNLVNTLSSWYRTVRGTGTAGRPSPGSTLRGDDATVTTAEGFAAICGGKGDGWQNSAA